MRVVAVVCLLVVLCAAVGLGEELSPEQKLEAAKAAAMRLAQRTLNVGDKLQVQDYTQGEGGGGDEDEDEDDEEGEGSEAEEEEEEEEEVAAPAQVLEEQLYERHAGSPPWVLELEDLDAQQSAKAAVRNDSSVFFAGVGNGKLLVEIAPLIKIGRVFAYDPLPGVLDKVKEQLSNQTNVQYVAKGLYDVPSKNVPFFKVVSPDPEMSGIVEITDDFKGEPIPDYKTEKMEVDLTSIDMEVDRDVSIDLIVIDAGGADARILKGAFHTIKRSRPLVQFKLRRGRSDYYGMDPEHVLAFLDSVGYKVALCQNFLGEKDPLDQLTMEGLHIHGRFSQMCAWPLPIGPDQPNTQAKRLPEKPDDLGQVLGADGMKPPGMPAADAAKEEL